MRVSKRVFALAAAGLLGVASQSKAQNVEFQGYTQACFYNSPGGLCSTATSSSEGLLLNFISAPFDVHTVGGFASVNLGTLGLALGDDNYTGDNFLLNVFFNTPSVSGAPAVFTAALKGAVQWLNGGAALIFEPNTQVYDFQSGENAGTFAFTVNNVSVDPGTSKPLTGTFEVTSLTATPEPATVALMATGLFCLIPVAMRRRNKTAA